MILITGGLGFRVREDTGYRPAYGTERAVADYIGWLRAGNER